MHPHLHRTPEIIENQEGKWSALVDEFRTCDERRLLILRMGEARQYMHIPGIVEIVTKRFAYGVVDLELYA